MLFLPHSVALSPPAPTLHHAGSHPMPFLATQGYTFDNILVGTDPALADALTAQWKERVAAEVRARGGDG